jgi:Circularly permutated YpsA SLOG family
MFSKIISGGQTGVDRVALDVALELGIPCGGWCPQGRRAEDGPIPERYPLQETPWSGYPQRTEWNIRDSDSTLVLTRGEPDGGTALTIKLATQYQKPLLVVDLEENPKPADVIAWAKTHGIQTLNVAGPREGECQGIYGQASKFLKEVLECSPAARG